MQHNILFINLIEPLHNGAGEGLGSIDRPVIRETPTSFPIIQPSSIKGVFRDFFTDTLRHDGEKVYAFFGPESGHGEDHAGAIAFGEGQLLAFPVRSLKGLFVWATCPRILFRFQRTLRITKTESLTTLEPLLDCIKTKDEQDDSFSPLVTQKAFTKLLLNNKLMLEEFTYDAEPLELLGNFATEIAPLIYEPGSYWAKQFAEKLVILSEDSFRYFVINSTEIMPNIRIGPDGVTEQGSLRYTEYLPREAVLYSILSYSQSRRKTMVMSEDKIQREFETNKPEAIQIGGDETTGKGLVEIKFLSTNQSNSKTGS